MGPLVSVRRLRLFLSDIYRSRKEQDKSINRDEGSHQLSHIYDRLFSEEAESSIKMSKKYHSAHPDLLAGFKGPNSEGKG